VKSVEIVVLQDVFPRSPDLLTGRRCTGPTRSPDLSPRGFFLWGYVKAEDFNRRPRTLEELEETIAGILKGMPVRVMDNFQERLHICVTRQRHHLDDIIFET